MAGSSDGPLQKGLGEGVMSGGNLEGSGCKWSRGPGRQIVEIKEGQGDLVGPAQDPRGQAETRR